MVALKFPHFQPDDDGQALKTDYFELPAGYALAQVPIPPAFHGQPFWTIAYDSTYLPNGWLSAGGVIRPCRPPLARVVIRLVA